MNQPEQDPAEPAVIETDDLKEASGEDSTARKWRPLTSIQRRVAGVLVEKAKTTPASYPMTANAIRNACNQKSNRDPVMNAQEDAIADTLFELRRMKAITEVHGDGRVPKYRQYLAEWLDVDNVELSVMTELLLRGEQTLGDLRARSSRMSTIDGLSGLKPIVASLIEKELIVELTPAGRGQIVTHNLYQPQEMEDLRKRLGSTAGPAAENPASSSRAATPRSQPESGRMEKLESELAELKQQVASLESRLKALEGST